MATLKASLSVFNRVLYLVCRLSASPRRLGLRVCVARHLANRLCDGPFLHLVNSALYTIQRRCSRDGFTIFVFAVPRLP